MTQEPQREVMDYDVLIVGAGPAGLAAAYRLRQKGTEEGIDLKVCVIEKGSEVGAHILSGAVIEPSALNALIPDWQEKGAPLDTPAIEDKFVYLTKKGGLRLPTPPQMRNHGNYVVSLGNVCRWLAQQAESVGVEVYPGFPGAAVLYDNEGQVKGVRIGDMGVAKDGSHKPNYQPGMDLHARYTLFAEGARGSLSKTLMNAFHLQKDCNEQTFGIGLKELWEVDNELYKPGLVVHTVGWPLDFKTYGGSFLYHMSNNQIAVGFVVGLDYENPYLNPFEEFQCFKTHPKIKPYFDKGRRISYGARALNEGGYQCIPNLAFPGGALIGCAAGFLNVPKIKGSHNAMWSGIIAADSIIDAFKSKEKPVVLSSYPKALQKSSVWHELKKVRNIRPSFHWGLWPGIMYSAIDTYIFNGRAPWTFHYKTPDNRTLKKAKNAKKIKYPKPDGVVTFDRLSSVYLSNLTHDEDQPCHLQLKDPEIPITVNLADYDAPEQRYCPAAVYEIVTDAEGTPHLQINAPNCVHCKTCDIKDPLQNINWVTPEGGSGPNYPNM